MSRQDYASAETDDRVGVVVLTALDLERDAIRAYLTDLRTLPHPVGTLFETGVIRGTPVRVALAAAGTGNRAAAVLVERASELFRPDAVFFVGIAGALRTGIGLGDVVVATRVYGYHGGKEEAGEFLARPRAWDAPHHLEQQARHLARSAWWEQPPHHGVPAPFKIHFGPVAAGEVVLNSRTGPLAELIRRQYNDVAAIEMESAGAAEAAHLNRVPMLAIRGISDRADGQKAAADAAGSQRIAAAHAAAFALTLATTISTGRPRELPSPATAAATTPRRPADLKRLPNRWALVALAVLMLAGLIVGARFVIVSDGANPGHQGGSGPTARGSSPDVSSIALTYPRSGYSVARSETISGTITTSDQRMSVWVIVRLIGSGRLIPHGPCSADLGTWICPGVQIGGEADAGHWYEIFAVAANADADATLASGRAAGLAAVPGGMPASPKISVRRR